MHHLLVYCLQDKSTIAAAEVVNSVVLEFASQKEKTVELIPGADVKSFLGEGDDVIQTHAESGRSISGSGSSLGGRGSSSSSVPSPPEGKRAGGHSGILLTGRWEWSQIVIPQKTSPNGLKKNVRPKSPTAQNVA